MQKLIRYKWKDNYKYVVTERLNDTAGIIYMYGIQDTITKGKVDDVVNMSYGMIRRAGR